MKNSENYSEDVISICKEIVEEVLEEILKVEPLEPETRLSFESIFKTERLGFVRDPFSDRPGEIKTAMLRQTKRTQRYRSTARSRICGMTVGDIRYCFQQLRSAGKDLQPELILYNGQCAGEFALQYLIETSNSMRKKRKRKRAAEALQKESEDEPENDLPASQIPGKKSKMDTDVYYLEF